jgi:hypothetical protein
MEWLQNNWTDILQIGAYIIAGASIIVKLTPTVKDDAYLAKVLAFLKVISLNKK